MSNKTNIEEDIKILENFLQTMKSDFRTGLGYEDELQAIENILADRERYKRLAEQNLKNSEEFKNNMCEHRRIKNNEILELQVKANKYDALVEKIKENLRNKQLIKETETISDREHLNGEIFALQELIPEEE